MHHCEDCGVPFERIPGPGRPRRFCLDCSPRDPVGATRAWRHRNRPVVHRASLKVTLSCHHCGAAMSLYRSVERSSPSRGKYCSRRCAEASRTHREASCQECGAVFHQKKLKQRFCSHHCYVESLREHATCVCGVHFVLPSPSHRERGEGKYCSTACFQSTRQVPLPLSRLTRATSWMRKSKYRVTRASYRVAVLGRPDYYVLVQPHDIACKQCGVVFHAKWRQLCDACTELNKRMSIKRSKNQRRAARAGADAVPYQPLDIFERDGWKCHLCGGKIQRDRKSPHPKSPSIDHLQPISRGGADAPINVAAAHLRCNTRRQVGGEVQLRLIA